MIQKSAVKKYIKEKDFRSSPDSFEGLQKVIMSVLDRAIEIAQKEKRKTIQGRDMEKIRVSAVGDEEEAQEAS